MVALDVLPLNPGIAAHLEQKIFKLLKRFPLLTSLPIKDTFICQE